MSKEAASSAELGKVDVASAELAASEPEEAAADAGEDLSWPEGEELAASSSDPGDAADSTQAQALSSDEGEHEGDPEASGTHDQGATQEAEGSPQAASSDEGSIVRRVVPEAFTIHQANEHKAWLLEAVASEADLELDLSNVTEIDTAGVQLLLLAERTQRRRGRTLSLLAPSAPVEDVLRILGLNEQFSRMTTADGEIA